MEDSSKLYEVAPGLTIRWCVIPPVPSPPLFWTAARSGAARRAPVGHLGNRGTAKQHHRAFEQRRRCGLLGCRYLPALPALLSDATPNRGLRVLCVFIVLIASSDAALAAGSMDEDDGDHDDHDTGDSEQDEQQQQAQKPRKRPCALPTGQLTDRTDKPTNRPTEPNSNQRQRHNNPNQQRRPTTTDNRPVNRQTLPNSGYFAVPHGKFAREIRHVW